MITTQEKPRNSGVSILSRVIDLSAEPSSPEAARAFLSLKFPKADERRMYRLAAKASAGTLTEAERVEAEEYNLVSHLVAYLQAKAEQTLRGGSRKSRPA